MRDLLFKNLTSQDHKRRTISFSEVVDNSGVRTIVRRHFIYFIKELAKDEEQVQSSPSLAVLKERNTKARTEKFVCKMKGSICITNNEKVYKIFFLHSLKICLFAIPNNPMSKVSGF